MKLKGVRYYLDCGGFWEISPDGWGEGFWLNQWSPEYDWEGYSHSKTSQEALDDLRDYLDYSGIEVTAIIMHLQDNEGRIRSYPCRDTLLETLDIPSEA